MQALQEQDKDLAGAHSLRDETALPGVGIDEHRRENVHQQVGGERPVNLRGSLRYHDEKQICTMGEDKRKTSRDK